MLLPVAGRERYRQRTSRATGLKVLTVFGIRPEAIKMAPLVLALQEDERFESLLCGVCRILLALESDAIVN